MNIDPKKYSVSWSSPSNIALIKYWGKRPIQIPANPSVSFTLGHSVTHLSMSYEELEEGLELDFTFESAPNEKFHQKILKYLQTQIDFFPWLKKARLIIQSTNTFPHSSGIASSASSMSALCLCLLSLDEKIKGKTLPEKEFLQEASRLSRLASGSAARSVYPFMASWGDQRNEYASPIDKTSVHEIFHDFCDSILIVNAGEKSVSSRAGHALMDTHPFKDQRFLRANANIRTLMAAMKEGDLDTFIEIVEEEALMLHALMMTSSPSYILLKPESLLLIEKIREYRTKTDTPVCFTIDAGPNIHLLYPAIHKEKVRSWIDTLIPGMKVLHDQVGNGPERHH